MPRQLLFLAFTCLIINVLPNKSYGCGYSFIGECSTGIHLRINNTLDSFNVAECSYGKNYNGLDLGTIQSLNLAKATAITWESCDNNVSSVGLYYRVYEQGQSGGMFSLFNLQEDFNQLEGPYTARYHSKFSNANLTTGLISGKTYVLEIYFAARIDTIGNDFIPETTLFQNNDEQNYQLIFEYGAASAPPFTVVTTQLTPVTCHGDSSGTIGVTVYGNQNNLFYQWSHVNNNFNSVYELAAGTYTVTVSGVNGYTQAQSVTVLEPDSLSLAFFHIQEVICGDTPGSASAGASGGTAPYSYFWETGEPDSMATIPLPGPWSLTVTDAKGCTAAAAVQVGGSSTLEQTVQTVICQGSVYSLGGLTFGAAGNYEVLVAGNGTCDTLFNLTLEVLDPGAGLLALPDSVDLTCLNPTASLCAENIPGISYEWRRGNVTVSSSACLSSNLADTYTVYATMQQSAQSCVAAQNIVLESHVAAPSVEVSGVATYADCNSTTASIVFVAQTNAEMPTFTWSLDGDVLSVTDSLFLEVADPLNFTPPLLVVVDVYGCQGTAGSISIVVNEAQLQVNSTLYHTSGANVADGAIQLTPNSGTGPYSFLWDNGATSATIEGLLPGDYCYTVVDASGCTSENCVELSFTNGTEEVGSSKIRIYPNPVSPGGKLHIVLPEGLHTQALHVELFNLQGQMLWQQALKNPASLLELNLPMAVPEGHYLILVKNEHVFYTQGIIFLK